MGEKAAAMAADDLGDGMQCADHPFRSNPGGICAFCLQDKLGKLVSSSSSPSSSSFPPLPPTSSTPSSTSSATSSARHRHPHPHPPPPPNPSFLPLKRSKSVAPRPAGGAAPAPAAPDSPRKKSFWSFLTADRRRSADAKKCRDHDGEAPSGDSSFGRKVARSRSVGCGSRSFSGDFLERISTGFGDCTLRRVESQREPDTRAGGSKMVTDDRSRRVKERVRCGGIFGGFGMISSSSSSSYWLSAAAAASVAADGGDDFGSTGSRTSSNARRNRNWGWVFASPMRAFKPVSVTKPFRPGSGKIGNGNPTTSLSASTVIKT